MKRLAISFLLLLLTVTLATGCNYTVKKIKLEQTRDEHLWLLYAQDRDKKTIVQHFDHPANLTVEQVKQMLSEVYVEEHSFFSWRDQGRLFLEAEREKLAPQLVEALQKADSDQWVHFAVTGMRKHLLLETKRLTDGICYVKDGQFHIIIGNFIVELIDPEFDPYDGDPRDRIFISGLRLKTDESRGIRKPKIVDGDKWLKYERVNWLIIDMDTYFASTEKETEPVAEKESAPATTPEKPAETPTAARPAPAASPESQPPAEAATSGPAATPPAAPEKPAETVAPESQPAAPEATPVKPDIAERLRKLQELYDKGLITEEEYRLKKKELLEEI